MQTTFCELHLPSRQVSFLVQALLSSQLSSLWLQPAALQASKVQGSLSVQPLAGFLTQAPDLSQEALPQASVRTSMAWALPKALRVPSRA